jgi:anti-anti-sigma factor
MVQTVEMDAVNQLWPPSEPAFRPFEVRVTESGHTGLVRVVGPLDVAQAQTLIERVRPVAQRSGCVVLDLRRTDFVDSPGVCALLRLHQEMEARGAQLRLVVRRDSRVWRTLELLRLAEGFHLYESAVDAWISQRPGEPVGRG